MNDLSRKNCEYGIVRRDVSGGAGVRLHARIDVNQIRVKTSSTNVAPNDNMTGASVTSESYCYVSIVTIPLVFVPLRDRHSSLHANQSKTS